MEGRNRLVQKGCHGQSCAILASFEVSVCHTYRVRDEGGKGGGGGGGHQVFSDGSPLVDEAGSCLRNLGAGFLLLTAPGGCLSRHPLSLQGAIKLSARILQGQKIVTTNKAWS